MVALRRSLLFSLGVTLSWCLSLPIQIAWLPERTTSGSQLDPYSKLPLLSFEKSKFRLAVVTDTHLLDGQENASNYAKLSASAVSAYLKQEQPNYVVHLGDYVSGEAANRTSDVRSAVRQILEPIVKAGLPFSSTKGNHDNSVYSNHKIITGYERELAPKLSYTGIAPDGVGGGDEGSDNYWVPVYPSSTSKRGSRPALILWFFDSRSGTTMLSKGNEGVDDWVDASVADWITSESNKMSAAWKTLPPSIAFVHIPPHNSATSQQSAPFSSQVGGVSDETPKDYESDGLAYPGLNADVGFGGQGDENTPYSGQDRAYLDAFLAGPGKSRIHTIVSGHQHGNDWCAPTTDLETAARQTVPVCFAKHSGFGGYDYDNWNHGARIFSFDLNTVEKSCSTHIRFLTGEKRYATKLDDTWTRKWKK